MFDQKEADDNLQQFLAEQTEEDILKIIKQCSMEEKNFPLVFKSGQSLPTLWHKGGFYIAGDMLVIDCGNSHIKVCIEDSFLKKN